MSVCRANAFSTTTQDYSRHPGRLALRGILAPCLQQIQLAIEQSLAARRAIGDEDAHLAVGDFAQPPTLLVGDPNRLTTVLGTSGLVQQQHTLGVVQLLPQHLVQFGAYALRGPGGLTEKVLQIARLGARCHLRDVLSIASVRLLHQQSMHLCFTMRLDFPAAKQGAKRA